MEKRTSPLESKRSCFLFLALAGVCLVWLPLLIPIMLSAVNLISRHGVESSFFLTPGLNPVMLLGSIILIIIAYRSGYRTKVLIIGSIFAAGGLIAALVFPDLLSGPNRPAGTLMAVFYLSRLVMTAIFLVIGIEGWHLMRELLLAKQQAKKR